MCTAPTAPPCAAAEGLSSFDVPISKLPFITNHPPFDTHRERVHGEGEKDCLALESDLDLEVLLTHHVLRYNCISQFPCLLPWFPDYQPSIKSPSDKPLLLSSLDFNQPTLLRSCCQHSFFETRARFMRQPGWLSLLQEHFLRLRLPYGHKKNSLGNVHTQILLILLPTSCPPCKVATIFPVFASNPRMTPSSPFTNTPAPLGRQTTCGVEYGVCGAMVLT